MGPGGSRERGFVQLESACFTIGVAVWACFAVYFWRTLRLAEDFSFEDPPRGAIWYYISSSPAMVSLLFGLVKNRVELYEPTVAEGRHTD